MNDITNIQESRLQHRSGVQVVQAQADNIPIPIPPAQSEGTFRTLACHILVETSQKNIIRCVAVG